MTAQERRKQRLVQFIRDVWDQGRTDRLGDYLAPTYTIHHDPGDPWDGQVLDHAGFIDRVTRSRAPFPDQCFAIQRLFADDDSVAMTWLWSATHQGEIAGFAATGLPIHMSGATVYHFDCDDRLTGHWQITDRLGVFQQLQRNAMAG